MSSCNCHAIVISCMDFRLHKDDFGGRESLCQVAGIDSRDFDLISIPGGVLGLCEKDSRPFIPDPEMLLSHVGLSCQLHSISKVVITAHTDCGAYGESGSEDRLKSDLLKAKEKVQSLHPTLEVVPILMRVHADGEDWTVVAERILDFSEMEMNENVA